MRFTPLQPPRAQVFLLFYKPSPDDHVLNKIVALFDGPFSHVEIAFPERYGEMPWEREMWGSSIYNGESVFFRPRKYARDGYVPVSIDLTLHQVVCLKNYCRAESEARRAFSSRAMYAAYLPFQLLTTDDTFCSKHVASAFRAADVPDTRGLNPALCTPSSLYRFITRSRAHAAVQQVVPAKLEPATMAGWSLNVVRDLLLTSRAVGAS